MEKESATIHYLRHIFASSQRQSWRELNHILHVALSSAINLRFEILPNDWDIIDKEMSYRYWAGLSANGHHYGERHYAWACSEHTPAAIEFERHFNRKPFILNGKRIYTGSRICDSVDWEVSGWTASNDTITLIHRTDEKEIKLRKITFTEWQKIRNEFKHCGNLWELRL